MRQILIVFLALGFSSLCHAADSIEINGNAAMQILNQLTQAGAFVDCGAGTCGTYAEDVKCVVHGNSVNKRVYSCTLKAQDETGAMTNRTINKSADAAALFDALTSVGVESDCGMGTCGVDVQSIVCLSHARNSFECGINR